MRLHLHEWGPTDAAPIICLHGVAGHGARFRKLAEEKLAARRVLAPDLRGHGHSDWEPPWRLETFVEDVLETAVAAGVERADWIGHSFGGRLVLEAAAAHPEVIERAVLLDPAIWVPPPIALDRAEALEDLSWDSFAEALDARVAQGGLYSTPREVLEEEVTAHLEQSDDGRLRLRFCRSAVVAAYSEMSRPPPLARVEAPTLIVRGAQTDVVPETALDFVQAELGGELSVVTVPGGHNVIWDAFGETAEAITRFLDTSPRS